MATARKKNNLKLERLEARDCPTAGALDLSFAGTGIALADFGSMNEGGNSVAIQPGGKIVVAGSSAQPLPPKGNQPPQTQYDFAVARFNSDGTLDSTFSADGKVLTDFQNKSSDLLTGVAIQPDGKIVVAGTSGGKFAVARYNPNGSLDTSFDGDGKVITSNNSIGDVGAVVLQPDGKILVGGRYGVSYHEGFLAGFALVRYNANGSLDASFDGDGISISAFASSYYGGSGIKSLELLGDGRIVAVGDGGGGVATIAIYTQYGALDTSFGGGDGHVESTDCKGWSDVAVQSGRLVVVSRTKAPTYAEMRPLIARYEMTGALDSTFGVGGLVVETSRPFCGVYYGVALQADGKIVACAGTSTGISTGPFDAPMVVRYSVDGALDTLTFGDNGIVITDISPTTDLHPAFDVAIQCDGRIVMTAASTDATGNASFGVVRYLGDNNLRAAATAPASSVPTLKLAQAQPLLTEAIVRWQSAGANVSALQSVNFRITDLGGSTLGLASGNTIWLDDNAAGHGWFVDRTPWSDSEFVMPGDQGEQNRIDLLTTLMHEVGHLLGHDHEASGVMEESLGVGQRLTLHGVYVGNADVDAVSPAWRDHGAVRRNAARLRR